MFRYRRGRKAASVFLLLGQNAGRWFACKLLRHEQLLCSRQAEMEEEGLMGELQVWGGVRLAIGVVRLRAVLGVRLVVSLFSSWLDGGGGRVCCWDVCGSAATPQVSSFAGCSVFKGPCVVVSFVSLYFAHSYTRRDPALDVPCRAAERHSKRALSYPPACLL